MGSRGCSTSRAISWCHRILTADRPRPLGSRLQRRVVGPRVLLEHAGHDGADIGGRAERRGDAVRPLALPVGSDEQIEAGLGVVHGAELGEAVGPEIGRLIDPIALAEIRHLHHDRLAAEIENAEAVDEVLRGAGDVALPRADIVVQHGEMIDRRDRCYSADQNRPPDAPQRGEAVIDVDHRPRPQIGEAADLTHEVGAKTRTWRGPPRKAHAAVISVLHRSDRRQCGGGGMKTGAALGASQNRLRN